MRSHFSEMRLKIQELNEAGNNRGTDGAEEKLRKELEECKASMEESTQKWEAQTSALKETVTSQNQIIGDLQELLLKRQGVNTDLLSESAQSHSRIVNEDLQTYLFNGEKQ